MSDLKNLIIVDITDNENVILAPKGIGATGEHEIKQIKGKGTLLVKNTSKKSRLWNLGCDLKETVNTSLKKILNVGSVNPGSQFKQEYDVQNLKTPCLKVLETLDAEREVTGKINNTFLYDNTNKCNLKFDLTNTLNVPFTEITLTKELPPILQDIDIKSPNFGDAKLDEKSGKKILTWKIKALPAKETATLEVYCIAHVKERTNQSLGSTTVNYLVENHNLTKINPIVRGITDSMSGVSRDEGSSPATWDCNVEFVNDSEFKVKLEKATVTHKIPTGSEFVVSEAPNMELEPSKSWNKAFSIETKNVPDLQSEIEFTPLFGVVKRVIGEIIKEATIYHILSAEVSKTIEPSEVAAYANTNMTITNKIPNLGSAPINTLEILDEIPSDFVPPTSKEIKVLINNPEGSYEIQDRAEYVSAININPDNQNPESKHIINIKLKDLEKQFIPKSDIKVTYPLLARNPKPEVRYNTPIEIKANVIVKGKEFIITPPEEPVLKIKYVARKLKTLKAVKPGTTEGEFSISVRIENKGDVELENLVVKDKIPSGFTLTEFTPPEGTTHEVISTGETSELDVKIPRIDANDSVSINYICSGSEDYPRSEPNVIVLGRTDAASSEVSAPSEAEKKPTMVKSKEIKIHDIFSMILNKIEAGITGNQLSELIIKKKDELPPGPTLHKLIAFAKEIKVQADKIIVGKIRDEFIAKLKEIKEKYS